MNHAFDSVWHEPAAADRPPVGTRDRVLGLGIAMIAAGEAIFRTDLAWPALAAAFGLVLAATY